jgi:hypothetical protein
VAELLIKAVSATNPDATKSARWCYKRGDPVVVMPDGWSWGTQEVIPPANGGVFVIIKIPDVTVAQALRFISKGTLTRKLYRVVVDELPAGIRNTLNTTGTITRTWDQIKSFIENKVTLERESGATP